MLDSRAHELILWAYILAQIAGDEAARRDSVRQVGVISGVEPDRHDQAAFGVI